MFHKFQPEESEMGYHLFATTLQQLRAKYFQSYESSPWNAVRYSCEWVETIMVLCLKLSSAFWFYAALAFTAYLILHITS